MTGKRVSFHDETDHSSLYGNIMWQRSSSLPDDVEEKENYFSVGNMDEDAGFSYGPSCLDADSFTEEDEDDYVDSMNEAASLLPIKGILKKRDGDLPPSSTGGSRVLGALPLLIVVYLQFLGNVCFSIVLPSLWPYFASLGGTKPLLGFAVAAFSLGQLISSPILGFWAQKRNYREVLLFALILAAISNVIYALSVNPAMIMFSRFLVGMSAGNVAVTRAYASQATPLTGRTKIMSAMSAAQGLGMVLGPAMGSLGVWIDFSYHGWTLNVYTFPAYLSALLSIASTGMLLFLPAPLSLLTKKEDEKKQEQEQEKDSQNLWSVSSWSQVVGLCLCWTVFVVITAGFTVLETILVPFTGDTYGWSVLQNSALFCVLGLLSIVVYAGLVLLSRFIPDRILLFPALVLIFLGFCAFFTWPGSQLPLWQFALALLVITLGYPSSQALSYSLYSQLIGQLPTGVLMGLLTSGGSLSRMVGPILATLIYEYVGGTVVFGVVAILCLGLLCLLLLGFHFLSLPTASKPPPPSGRGDEASTPLFRVVEDEDEDSLYVGDRLLTLDSAVNG